MGTDITDTQKSVISCTLCVKSAVNQSFIHEMQKKLTGGTLRGGVLTSLRGRLIAGTIVGTLAIYVAAAVIVYGAIRESLLSEFDKGLQIRANVLMGLTEQHERGGDD